VKKLPSGTTAAAKDENPDQGEVQKEHGALTTGYGCLLADIQDFVKKDRQTQGNQ